MVGLRPMDLAHRWVCHFVRGEPHELEVGVGIHFLDPKSISAVQVAFHKDANRFSLRPETTARQFNSLSLARKLK